MRFKTANVTVHVQPFKYSLDEPPITDASGAYDTYLSVRNTGNIYSKPKLIINGSNTINVYLGNTQIFNINLSAACETIIIDAESMNATDEAGNYLNRQVTGDYDNFRLATGINELKITGYKTSVTLENYSRWI